MKISFRFLAPIALLPFLYACGNADAPRRSATSFEKQYGEFQDALRQCGEMTGYDPAGQSSLGPYELGQGELQWRDCAYTALLMFVIPNTPYPALYMALVDEDKELTRGIQEKHVTRNEREAKISDRRQEIIAREEKAARLRAAQADQEERMRIDMISTSMHALARNAQRSPR